jgi:class 3 adenylate cyclase/tetratricopeptide (TPR) repeat protein
MAPCPSCGGENPDGHRFCGHCGGALALVCASCGAVGLIGERFCGSCGGGLGDVRPSSVEAPVAERRLVSVLFADLVGFTPLSEARDAEEVREILSRYFDTCRRLVELYGGVVEKFIGDAVMAVWGTPTAMEDDAERAVRTALDLVAAVSALGDEIGAPELRARAGVLTGEAAVNLSAVGQGMVAGDLVNTAARIQSEAAPATVLVGETTRRASEQSVAYEDAGEHELKGKATPTRLYRAVRITAARGGALKSEGLEAPFVGRERELRLVKELYHASADQGRAQFVQITGIAGIGKSRLAWEFFKYCDGLVEEIWWHRGRCLAYGEGVAYWALAEMVRTRAQILEGEDQSEARVKLDACVHGHVTDEDERAWVTPRLANLLGLDDRADTDRQDLFAAWRLFFERMADQGPLVMVFEDVQWADQALLAFIEYLLEWSANQKLYVVTLARPELAEQHPDFARTVKNATSLALEPLPDAAMTRLLAGYVPGISEDLAGQILARAQGIPLYAVETVRMLLDRGLLVRDGPVYRPTTSIESLEVPETLHALAAARLDGLPGDERQLVQQACVLGKTFTKRALAALSGQSEETLEPLLASLVRKEVLSLQADPRWPERGQYGFLQELLRQVAYDTLSRRDRKARHLAAVTALAQTFEGADQEVPEVIAAHLLAAAEAAPEDADTGEIRMRARIALVHAGERAAALAAPDEAQRYLDQAAALADGEPEVHANLLERAAIVAAQSGRSADARERYEAAIELLLAAGDQRGAALVGSQLAEIDVFESRLDEGIARFETVLPLLEAGGPSAELAATLGALGRVLSLRGEPQAALLHLERALRLAEHLQLEEVLVHALISKAVVLMHEDRFVESRLLCEGAAARAEAAGLHGAWSRAINNIGVSLERDDRVDELLALAERAEEDARRRGDRERLANSRMGVIAALVDAGRWSEAVDRAVEAADLQASRWALAGAIESVPVYCERGELDRAQATLDANEWQRNAEQADVSVSYAYCEAALLRALGRPRDALAAAERGLERRTDLALGYSAIKRALGQALEAAFELEDWEKADELLGLMAPLEAGELTPQLEAQQARFTARLGAVRGESGVGDGYARAAQVFASCGFVFLEAVTQVEHGEWLAANGGFAEAQPLLARARATFERIDAPHRLARIAAAGAVAVGA